MRTLPAAARLLDGFDSIEAAGAILHELGFGTLAPLPDDRLRLELGEARIARGRGSLRALAFECPPGEDIRVALVRVAARLESGAPRLLWIIACTAPGMRAAALAAVDAGSPRHRVVSLVVRPGAIVDSDAETLLSLSACRDESDALTHIRWIETLGREALSRKFFRELERMVDRLARDLRDCSVRDASQLALLCVSRLLFLSFLETKGWLDRDHAFLSNRFADCMASGGGFHRRVLSPLFFGTLNTPSGKRAPVARAFGRVPFLNGGLFTRTPVEKRCRGSEFGDEALGDLFADLLLRYRFTAREDSTAWSEAAIDPEMLGKAFESLMSSAERRSSGAFYTPQNIVETVTDAALRNGASELSLDELSRLRLLDPACGSGAFLVHALERIAALRAAAGDERPLHRVRREVLRSCIFGVDVNATAVWLCELRLWLSVAIEDPEKDPLRVTPLPNLDRNVRVGDSLAGEAFLPNARVPIAPRIAKLRNRYCRATGPRKRALARTLDSLERRCARAALLARIDLLGRERSEILELARTRDLFGQRVRPGPDIRARLAELRLSLREARAELRRLGDGGALPFSFAAGFADVCAHGGFYVIVGNPPWIRPHRIARSARDSLRARFFVRRHSAWLAGAESSAAGRGFASQVDTAALFVERSIDLVRPGGVVSLLIPAKLLRSLSGGGLRSLLLSRSGIREVHDLSDGARLFDAAVYPAILTVKVCQSDTLSRACPSMHRSTRVTVHRRGRVAEWETATRRLALDSSLGSPWLLLPGDARTAFDSVQASGLPLAESLFGRPLLGVKTGCNDAFLVSDEQKTAIEPAILRPAIRGEMLQKWACSPASHSIIWTHDEANRPLASLPPGALKHLSRWRRELEGRADGRRAKRWWMLFRTAAANSDVARVVWSDIGRSPRAVVLRPGDPAVPLNTCYVVRAPSLHDALALATILNGTLAAAWLSVIAELARGGYRRFMGWCVSAMPLPRDWPRAATILAPLAARASDRAEVTQDEIDEAVLDAFMLPARSVRALLDWV